MAVKLLSAELYSKDVHFLMEIIQNAEDNEYPEGVEPSLEFFITSQDITTTGAPATLLIFNNEKGFSHKNVESICSVGESTKAGNRKRGYIGEKGIGFKSVFLLTAHPYIFSNGYQIRFSEAPCPECDIAYIVPEWVENKPSISDIQRIYGYDKTLPTTTLILPLKDNKVKAVKDQLSSLHPELLLFLSKIKRLSIKADNEDPALNKIQAISITTERDFVSKKDISAESYTVLLNAEEEGVDPKGGCWYYMWKQRFPVKKENIVQNRIELEEWPITLAFPFGNRLNRGMSSPGIYAFLPTETVTNLPFIIQADFLLPSSRETILWDNIWNQGILDCVPTAFVNAFVSLVRTTEDAPVSSIASMFAFLPVNKSSHEKLNVVRESIRVKLLKENIIPSESHSCQKIFHKPQEVGRLMPSFWNVLLKAKEKGLNLHGLTSQGKHILHSSFDAVKYHNMLTFLGVMYVHSEWYSKCIQSCNLVLGVEEEIYIELLQFIAVSWVICFRNTSMRHIPLLKYVGISGDVSLLSIHQAVDKCTGPFLCCSQDVKCISSMIEWSKEFGQESKLFFLPEAMQNGCLGLDGVLIWLRDFANVKTLSMFAYASLVSKSLKSSRVVFAFAHFLQFSYSNEFLNKAELQSLCSVMPLVNHYRGVSFERKGVLVPATGSKWVELIGSSRPWEDQGYVVLSDEYLHSAQYAGHFTPEKELMNSFLKKHVGASDIPNVHPPDAAFPTVSGPLTKKNVFLLLDWIRKLRSKGIQMADKFLSCIENGSWLRVMVSGSPGYRPPNQSFFSSSSWGSLLQNGSEMVDIPLVNQQFYGSKISDYQEELKAIGVMVEYNQACEFIGKNLMALATQHNLTRDKVLIMLNFLRFLREKFFQVDDIVNGMKEVKWVKTSCGERSPVETVLFDRNWKSASAISNIPFLDQDYYGEDILKYTTELNLLGITVNFKDNYELVLSHLKPSASLNCLSAEDLIFALKCISCCGSDLSEKLVSVMEQAQCLKTISGFMYPKECFLCDHEWGCILQIFEGFPYIDDSFYGNRIFQYKDELRKIGVVVDFSEAAEALSIKIKEKALNHSISIANSLSIILCYQKLTKTMHYTLPANLRACIMDQSWLKTRLGDFRPPKECILFKADWRPISRITLLPFVDDSESCYGEGIYQYEVDLKRMGVVIDLNEGSNFVLSNLFFPANPRDIPPESVISLLQCVRSFSQKTQDSLPKDFEVKVHQTKWLKTSVGYLSPKECLLFDPEKNYSLQQCDGPFIDEEYYGPDISSYKKELAAVGVIVDMSSTDASSLLAFHINLFCEFAKIQRIYDFLSQAGWKPDDNCDSRIWIPTGTDDGLWVPPGECVLYDDDNLFSSRLHVLYRKNYRRKLLVFFSKAFDVRSRPSTDDYCRLWKDWQNSRRVISVCECCAFWSHIITYWSEYTEKMVSESVTEIPVDSDGSNDLLLLSKQEIFIPDDLLLADLFEKSSPYSLFAWCPTENLHSIPVAKLLDIYSKIGVRKISNSVRMLDISALNYGELIQADLKDAYIVKGLIMIIIGFLTDPSLNIDVQRRRDTVNMLLKLRVFETRDPVRITYSLKMTSSDVTASTTQMVRWEREKSEFFIQKLDRSRGFRSVIEYATKFSEVVSQGLLWDMDSHAYRLSELIMYGFLMDFDEDAVSYFMKSKNLQIVPEDEEFLMSIFPLC
ncbi:unnamed protein product [Amaranthus hypochondriacus]